MLTQWFDIAHLSDPAYRCELQVPGLQATAQTLLKLLREEQEAVPPANVVLGGISQGCAAAVSVLISQDPAVQGLGGFVGLCGFLPFQGEIEAALVAAERARQPVLAGQDFFLQDDDDDNVAETNEAACAAVFERDLLGLPSHSSGTKNAAAAAAARAMPVFLGHGVDDVKVPVRLAQAMATKLQRANYDVHLRVYEGLGHSYKVPEEMDGILAFLRTAVGWAI